MSEVVIDGLARNLGFQDSEEMLRLIREADISSYKKYANFENWRHNDGTKEGLLKLKEIQYE